MANAGPVRTVTKLERRSRYAAVHVREIVNAGLQLRHELCG